MSTALADPHRDTCPNLLPEYSTATHHHEQRLIFKVEGDVIYLLSFGPREGIYK